MLRIAITGSSGLVGSRIVELLSSHFDFIPLLHKEVDITDTDSVSDFLHKTEFDILCHLAAYTNVDKAEDEKEKAYAINVTGTKNLYMTCKELRKNFVYLSTDFVFSGSNPPYFEDSIPNPIGYYGQSKFEGELELENNAMIVRISYPYRNTFERKKDFVRTIKWLLEQKKEIEMVNDSLFVPTYIDDVAHAMSYLLDNFKPSIYHVVGTQALSPYDAGILIAQHFNLDESLIHPTSYSYYFKDKAKRPKYSDVRSKSNTFYAMKSFKEGLTEL